MNNTLFWCCLARFIDKIFTNCVAYISNQFKHTVFKMINFSGTITFCLPLVELYTQQLMTQSYKIDVPASLTECYNLCSQYNKYLYLDKTQVYQMTI